MKKMAYRFPALLALLLLPERMIAQELYIYCGNLPGCGSGFIERFSSILILLLTRLPVYVYVLGVLFVMIGGAYILLSAGSDERVTKGKNTIIWAVIGIFLAEFAQTLVSFIVLETNTRLSGSDLIVSVANTLISSIFNLLYVALIGVAIFSGMRMVLSFGKEEEFKKGHTGLFYAALGAIIINLAQQIVNAFATL